MSHAVAYIEALTGRPCPIPAPDLTPIAEAIDAEIRRRDRIVSGATYVARQYLRDRGYSWR